MKRILVVLFVIVPGINAVYADEWGAAREKDYFSENRRFVGHITPAKEKEEPLLEVFEIKDTQRLPLWQCKMGNEVAPVEVYVSNDGRYALTLDEWHKVGYGDHVVAFYCKKGWVKNYSMEEVLHLPKDISVVELRRLIPHSVSSRWWHRNSIKFFDTYAGELYFCIWLDLFERWVAWNPANGEEVEVNGNMVKMWNHKGRLWALRQIEKSANSLIPYEFLGKQKNPDDRCLFEALLSDDEFYLTRGGLSRIFRTSRGTAGPKFQLISSSPRRSLAERVLAIWDGKPMKDPNSSEQLYYYLGKVELAVKLPQTDKAKEGNLLIYLIPSTIERDNWRSTLPIHRFAANLAENRKVHEDCLYGIEGVTPGKYLIKVVWDKAKPYWNRYERPPKICLPQQGDYESTESPIITVKAGEIVGDIAIDCTREVAKEALPK